MSYEQQNWVTGNRITAEKLNHMEQGISSAGGGTALIIRYDHTEEDTDYYTFYFDKTWQEVVNALTNFTPVYMHGFDYGKTTYSEDPLKVINISYAVDEDGEFYVISYDNYTRRAYELFADSANSALYYRGSKVS